MEKLTKPILAILDIVWLIVLFYITTNIRQEIYIFELPEFNRLTLYDFSFVVVIVFVLFYYEGIYKFRYDFWQDTFRVIRSLIIGFILTFAILSLSKTNLEYSRAFIVIYFSLSFVLLPIFKRYTKKIIFYFDGFKKDVLVVGQAESVEIFKKEISKNWYLGLKFNKKSYDSVIVISKGLKQNKLSKLIDKYLHKTAEVFLVPYITDINFAHSNIMEYSNIRVNAIQIENKLLLASNILVKDIFDKVVSFLILPIFLVIHMIVVVAIRVDSKGCVWFKQHRLGKDDVDFEVYKYRTMYENSDKLLERYLENNPDEVVNYEEFHKYKNDPRITKVGKFLRATSLDEFPQIINVLKGDMSLVGPRPYMLSESEKLEKNKHLILKVKPGITGLWQVSGRNNLTFKERYELEVWYIKNWSLWADLVILIKTIKVVLGKVGAR
ncbi:MAG: exopolysaccharide biosynthesis polyprenyl glycosylphosphotransferase [Campylobacterota bacterium]|nr:exopolysaccharide biosynthesis polyprenyl glycosylphosphotransferase [Campylobacterota bacterium]